ncbi:hypothetical protein BKA56DRAFT_617071 [Ilyonectria sp. MPI-CAGE-AT-0026]|nr:hypothetical protein BKA56DRAFT_617071 [Ilyonectria sp. MPI-CAGE-AT-0026]
MAPTKQTRRKSTGGKAPRKRNMSARYSHFEDHAGQTYTVVRGGGLSENIAKLGIQLYCLGSPHPSPEALGNSFLNCDAIEGWGNARNRWPRVDVHSNFSSIEECVDHHRREKAYRMQAIQDMRESAVAGLSEEAANEKLINEIRGKEPLPHIVPTWCPSAKFWTQYNYASRYRSWILVLPEGCLSWEDVIEKGIYQVSFDLDITPAMETEMYDCDIEEDTLLDCEKHGWVEVEKSGLEKCQPVQTRLLCARERPRDAFLGLEEVDDIDRIREALDGWKTPGHESTLSSAWQDAVSGLWDCTYRQPSCDGCYEGEPHDLCEVELDEHYFDEDGQCIACRRVTEYRRRSKRIAAMGG